MMKKIIVLTVLALLVASCNKNASPYKLRYVPVNIGSNPDDGQGDNLRTAFSKINAGFIEIADSLDNIYTKAQTRKVVGDSISGIRDSALAAQVYYFERSDTIGGTGQLITISDLNTAIDQIGAGSASTRKSRSLEFIVGATDGAPVNGDSTIYHSAFANRHVYVFRGTTGDLYRQNYNATARNEITGYRMSNDTVIVRPAFLTGDRVVIETVDSIEFLTFGTNRLLNGLMAYWKLDDSGSTAKDSHSNNDGTISAGVTTGEAGVLANAFSFNGTSSNVFLGTVCRPTNAISISFWFNIANITSGGDQWFIGNGVYSTHWCGYWVSISINGRINFRLGTNTATLLDKSYGSGLDDGSWHHIVCTWDGTNAYIYVDNVKSTATAYSTDIVYVTACRLRMGSNAYADGTFYAGLLDEVCIYNRSLSDAEVDDLFNKTPYPFE